MADPRQLPHLLQLLDDDSPIVREMVLRELASFGSGLDTELQVQGVRLSDTQRQHISALLVDRRRTHLGSEWPKWIDIADEGEKLEIALGLLSDFLSDRDDAPSLKSLLDKLVLEYESTHEVRDARSLAHFLFTIKRLRGADEAEYYNPQNMNLVHVIREKRGIPISLASLYILTGSKLHLSIEGCNFPGHFLAFAHENDHTYVVDCFNAGRFLEIEEFTRLDVTERISTRDILQLRCDSKTIVARSLRNLVNVYHRRGDLESKQFMIHLLEPLEPIDDEEE